MSAIEKNCNRRELGWALTDLGSTLAYVVLPGWASSHTCKRKTLEWTSCGLDLSLFSCHVLNSNGPKSAKMKRESGRE